MYLICVRTFLFLSCATRNPWLALLLATLVWPPGMNV